MSISKVPGKGYRVQIYDCSQYPAKTVAVSKVLPEENFPAWFEFKADARKAEAKAKRYIAETVRAGAPTVAEFAERWLTSPLFARPKESTQIINERRLRYFLKLYGHKRLNKIGHVEVAHYLAHGSRDKALEVRVLAAMYADAMSMRGGRIVEFNPFQGLRLEARGRGRSVGNRFTEPPTSARVWELIESARELTEPGFAALLQVACFTGMRPGELFALEWDAIDWQNERIHVRKQFNRTSRNYTLPKNGLVRTALLTSPARDALMALDRTPRKYRKHVGKFCFISERGYHFTDGTQQKRWNKIRAATGFDDTWYIATRHYFGAYAINTLKQDSHLVAWALGHSDNGALVRRLYGHYDRERGMDEIGEAFRENLKPAKSALKLVGGKAS